MVVCCFFVVKEVVYKCQYIISCKIFGFDNLSVVFDCQGCFDVCLMKDVSLFEFGMIFKGMIVFVGDQIFSFCWIGEGYYSDVDF